jgi:2-polyprenyl-3-methyl-5-hydroxy-6-metoxy-1,4-benzoquinol methylase
MSHASMKAKGAYSTKEVFPAIKSFLKNKKGRIIDLGAGWGHMTDLVANLGFEVVAVEMSPEKADYAKKQFPDIKFFCCDVYDIPEKVVPFEAPFDFVVATELIEHLFDPEKFLNITKQLLKENGLLILSTPYHGYLKNLMLAFFNKMDDHFKVWELGGHIKFFSKKSLFAILKKAKYRPIKFVGAGRCCFLYKSMVVISKINS